MPSLVVARARQLRREMTKVEWKLWAQLRNRQVDGHKFRRQHPIGDYIADFVCVRAGLVIEVDGPTHDGTLDYDAHRTEYLERRGLEVMRVTASDVDDNLEGVVEHIRLLLSRSSPPIPASPESPPRERGGS